LCRPGINLRCPTMYRSSFILYTEISNLTSVSLPRKRELHTSTSQLNASTVCGIQLVVSVACDDLRGS